MSVESVILPDGARLAIRPVEPGDRDLLAEAFARLSPESRYRRFFRPMHALTERELDYLTVVDHRDHEALIALDEASGRLVGVARFIRTAPEVAEPAVTVADDWQRRGVGTVLLERLVERALAEGIQTFAAVVLATNQASIQLMHGVGEVRTERDGSTVDMEIALRRPAAKEPAGPLRTLLRAVAAGAVAPALTVSHRLLPRRTGRPHDDRANVVVAVVGPPEGSEAAALAADLAEAAGSEVVLVAARHPLAGDDAALERHVARLAARLRPRAARVREEIRTGDLAAAALDVAIDERARLIVVERTPDNGGGGRLVGRTWDHISHHAPCDVLVVRG